MEQTYNVTALVPNEDEPHKDIFACPNLTQDYLPYSLKLNIGSHIACHSICQTIIINPQENYCLNARPARDSNETSLKMNFTS